MRKTVTYVKLHASAFLPGAGGELTSTLPPTNKTLDLKMYKSEEGILLYLNGGRTEAIIPWANVQVAVYGSEAE